MNGSRQHRLGATLIEMLGYALMLGVLVNICMTTFVRTSRLSALSTETVLRRDAMNAFARDFTRLTRSATEVMNAEGPFTTDATQVVLRTRDGVRVAGAVDGKLAIWAVDEASGCSIQKIDTYPVALERIRFVYDAEPANAARLITCEITVRARERSQDPARTRLVVAGLRAGGMER